jgi:hypothetical protein
LLLDLGLGVGDLAAQDVISRQPRAGAAGLVLLGRLLQHQIALGDRVGGLRGEIGILRLELDRDHARLLHLKRGEPFVVALEHPLLGRHLQRILGEADDAEDRMQRAGATQDRVEFRTLGELELLDDLAGEVAG